MFDSLNVELDGREREFHTKSIDCIPEFYLPDDWISNSLADIPVVMTSLKG